MSIVADHLQSLMTLVQVSESTYRPVPKDSLTHREQKLFWRYHGHFPNDFAKAIVEYLPEGHKFISYDHLQNLIHVESL